VHITCEACGHQTGVVVTERNVRVLMREIARWRWARVSQEGRSHAARVAAKARWRKVRREEAKRTQGKVGVELVSAGADVAGQRS
jgi:hypothetical protein